MNRLTASVATAALVVGASGMAATGPAAAAKKYTACVKKSTGEVRILLGKPKKCKKGWKKTSWTKAGPTGAKGSDGPTGVANTFGFVVDGDGVVIGQSVGSFPAPIAIFPVRIDGGIFIYYPNGWLVPLSETPYYDNAACSGVPFIAVTNSLDRDSFVLDSSVRVVYRSSAGASLGPASAYKPDGTSTSVLNQARWSFNSSGACVSSPDFSGYRLPLVSVPAPPDYKGPLRFM
ncbi:MAG: hypothetical protein MUD05_07635 [Candidatus Nanopelagicales bacterium]|jgi:hypothetical protein|nr:hypothetical protein [Candidatus Nanopelagicales bacterium]